MTVSETKSDGFVKLILENQHLVVKVVPALGGKIVSIYHKALEKEFLWHHPNLSLTSLAPGADYDTNFYGGIDELLPNDIPETVDGIDYPDHGELWTTPLNHQLLDHTVSVYGVLPASQLYYKKTISLEADAPKVRLQYQIINQSGCERHFLWKLHAALAIAAGDFVDTPATHGKIVYPESSRFHKPGEFTWPLIDGIDASKVPAKDNTMDFFYLLHSPEGKMSMISHDQKHRFTYYYDTQAFPYQWYFASYGKFLGHYVAILEPASAMPVSVAEASSLGQCSTLAAGEEINTEVSIYAGPNNR